MSKVNNPNKDPLIDAMNAIPKGSENLPDTILLRPEDIEPTLRDILEKYAAYVRGNKLSNGININQAEQAITEYYLSLAPAYKYDKIRDSITERTHKHHYNQAIKDFINNIKEG